MLKRVAYSILAISSLNAFDISSIDISSIKSIETTIGDIDKTINDYWSKYDVDTLVKSAGLDNKLVGCLTDGANIKDLIGSAPSLGFDGMCSSLSSSSMGVGSLFDNPLVKCSGIEKPSSLKDAEDLFSSFCGTTTKDVTKWVYDDSTGGWKTEIVSSTSMGDTPKFFSPTSVVITSSVSNGVTGGINLKPDDTKKIENKKYTNGLTNKQVLGDNGGKVLANAFKDPRSSDAQAVRQNNVATLELKEMASKLNKDGSTDESKIGLPATKLEVVKEANAVAEIVGLSSPDLDGLTDRLIEEARKRFTKIDADTLDEYYIKEKQEYSNMIKTDSTVSAEILSVKQKALDGISTKYALKLFAYKKNKDYIFDTSEATAQNLNKGRDEYVFRSMIQNSEIALIKGQEAEEKRKVIAQIDKAIYNAYPLASIFRPDIAKKEIDAILKAVDTAIR